MSNYLQIGEVAKLADVNIQTVRYYEKRGILKPVKRKDSGFRLYGPETVKTLNFIKHAKDLGFTLEEVKELLALRATTPSRCKKVRGKAITKLGDIQEKLKLLKQMEKNLKSLIIKCEAQETATGEECPIIEGLEE